MGASRQEAVKCSVQANSGLINFGTMYLILLLGSNSVLMWTFTASGLCYRYI